MIALSEANARGPSLGLSPDLQKISNIPVERDTLRVGENTLCVTQP